MQGVSGVNEEGIIMKNEINVELNNLTKEQRRMVHESIQLMIDHLNEHNLEIRDEVLGLILMAALRKDILKQEYKIIVDIQ